MVVVLQVRGDVTGGLAKLVQVLADAEPSSGAGEHDGTDAGVCRFVERARESLVHLARERVEHVGPVERDREDGPVPRGLDVRHLAAAHHPKRQTFGTVPSQTRDAILTTLAAGRRLGVP